MRSREGSHATQARKAAYDSRDANRILLHFRKSVAIALYYNSLNCVSASKLTDAQLLKMKGVGPKAVEEIRIAMKTSKWPKGTPPPCDGTTFWA